MVFPNRERLKTGIIVIKELLAPTCSRLYSGWLQMQVHVLLQGCGGKDCNARAWTLGGQHVLAFLVDKNVTETAPSNSSQCGRFSQMSIIFNVMLHFQGNKLIVIEEALTPKIGGKRSLRHEIYFAIFAAL